MYGRGLAFQFARDIGLLLPDVAAVAGAIWMLFAVARRRKVGLSELLYKEKVMLAVVFVTLSSLIGRVM